MKDKQKAFYDDLQKLYDEVGKDQAELFGYYKLLQDDGDEQAKELVVQLLQVVGLPDDKKYYLAALDRLVRLREDALAQSLQKEGFDECARVDALERAYDFVSSFYLDRFERLIKRIEHLGLLNEFYRKLIYHTHLIGVAMSRWQKEWNRHILHTVNVELERLFETDEAKIIEMLRTKGLLDKDEEQIADRCYSVLVKEKEEYRRSTYKDAFKEIAEIVERLQALIDALGLLEDDVFGQKEAWTTYFQSIVEALGELDCDRCVGKWREVDRKWMRITTPLQVGHPLEYYEDRYRKAVAPEWDVRLANPSFLSEVTVAKDIADATQKVALKIGEDAMRIWSQNLEQIKSVQLYIGRPMLFYGSEFNGLFSAQVVPNDETVSRELGKKIFAFGDFILESAKHKPAMRISIEVFGEEFVKKQRSLMRNEPKRWHQIYAITTIGHEYGHILWIDEDTETVMNKSGAFKLIEEFKATTGGLIAYFENESGVESTHIIDDLVSRAVGLIAWQEVGEVLPYYTEALVHLSILFETKTLHFDKRLHIDYERYWLLKERYKDVYVKLAQHYVNKSDAADFLYSFAYKIDGVYLPKNKEAIEFVRHYYARYKAIGQETIALD